MERSGGTPAIRWVVTEEMIDFDQWAKVYVDTVRGNIDSNVTRWGIWPFYVVFAAVVIATALTDPVLALVPLALGAVTYGLVVLWNRGAAQRMAQKLRALPAASEPFTFVADETGTHAHSESQSTDVSWRRYRSVTLKDGLVVLTRDDGAIVPLPTAGLVGLSPNDAAERLSAWIASASEA